MVCPSVDSIFLRAWGDLACWDDAGSEHVLHAWDPGADYGRVFLEGSFEQVRLSLAEDRMPRPRDCTRCLLLQTDGVQCSSVVDERFVRILRVEPSYLCTLDCPGCVPLAARPKSPGTANLRPAVLERLLSDLRASDIDVYAIDFQGHGEPLLNPHLWEMIRLSRDRFPTSWVTVTTNAHGRAREEHVKSGLDEIVCAIDGVDQDSYERYRVHGRFDLAWTFMKNFVSRSRSMERGPRVVWKYVLFEHNSSRDQVLRAQELAAVAGVHELVFVFTRNGPPPRDFQTPEQIPRLEGSVPIGFRYHQPLATALENRFEDAQRLHRAGDLERSREMVLSICAQISRFFPQEAHLPPPYGALVTSLAKWLVASGLADAAEIARGLELRTTGRDTDLIPLSNHRLGTSSSATISA